MTSPNAPIGDLGQCPMTTRCPSAKPAELIVPTTARRARGRLPSHRALDVAVDAAPDVGPDVGLDVVSNGTGPV